MKNLQKIKQQKKIRRARRVRSKIFGSKEIPRLSVFRSLKHFSAQLIDDIAKSTIASVNDNEFEKTKKNKTEKAFELGKIMASKAQEKGIKKVVFDRKSYMYHGRVKAFADGAREGGLEF